MKAGSFSSIIISIIFIAALGGCKKDKQESDKIIVSTLAGSTDGFADGSSAGVKFNRLRGIATDGGGYSYVTDAGNYCIRKISPSGIVSTPPLKDANGNAFKFREPEAIAADGQGNIYVTERFSILKITSAGVVSTLAGSNTSGFADGPAGSAKFSLLKRISTDAQNNIYVTELSNRIRKISSSGMVSTLAGDGTAGYIDGNGKSAKFNDLRGIAVDVQGNVFVADAVNASIRKITPSGFVSTIATFGEPGVYSSNYPTGLAVDVEGNIFMSSRDCQIRKILPSGTVKTIAGGTCGYVDGNGSAARFSSFNQLATDAQGNIYLADYLNSRVRKISLK